MRVLIINGENNRSTMYQASDLIKDARFSVKGKGKLVDYWVSIQDGAPRGATVCLTATYEDKKGMRGQVNTAI